MGSIVGVRFTEGERARIEVLARKSRLTLSKWIRGLVIPLCIKDSGITRALRGGDLGGGEVLKEWVEKFVIAPDDPDGLVVEIELGGDGRYRDSEGIALTGSGPVKYLKPIVVDKKGRKRALGDQG